MTKEQVITRIKHSSMYRDDRETADYIIDALEQQPSDDCANREFIKIVVDYPPEELCTYPEYRGKPYFSIEYKENNEDIIGYGTYNSDILSAWLKEYFIQKPKIDVLEQIRAEITAMRSMQNCSCADCLDIIDKYRK